MKKLLFITGLAIIIVSCKKSDEKFIDPTGTWEMVGRGGIDHYTTYPKGTGNILQLNSNRTYTLTENFTQVGKGSYTVMQQGASKSNKTFTAIYFSDKSYISSLSMERDSLLWIGTAPNDADGNLIMDGGTTSYIRKK